MPLAPSVWRVLLMAPGFAPCINLFARQEKEEQVPAVLLSSRSKHRAARNSAQRNSLCLSQQHQQHLMQLTMLTWRRQMAVETPVASACMRLQRQLAKLAATLQAASSKQASQAESRQRSHALRGTKAASVIMVRMRRMTQQQEQQQQQQQQQVIMISPSGLQDRLQ
jgi:hypothetical protein